LGRNQFNRKRVGNGEKQGLKKAPWFIRAFKNLFERPFLLKKPVGYQGAIFLSGNPNQDRAEFYLKIPFFKHILKTCQRSFLEKGFLFPMNKNVTKLYKNLIFVMAYVIDNWGYLKPFIFGLFSVIFLQ
jgi:hypothetical protein